MSENGGIDIGNIAMIGALIVAGYVGLKYLLPALKGLGGVSDAISGVTSAVLPSTPLEAVGAVPGAAEGLLLAGPVGAVVGSAFGKELAPQNVEQVQGFELGGILGGLAGPVGMVIGTQIGKALSPSPTVSSNKAVPGLISSTKSTGPFITYTGNKPVITQGLGAYKKPGGM